MILPRILTQKSIDHGLISEEDQEIYEYGFEITILYHLVDDSTSFDRPRITAALGFSHHRGTFLYLPVNRRRVSRRYTS